MNDLDVLLITIVQIHHYHHLQIENDLLNSEVLYTDGTVVTENGKQSIIRRKKLFY